jgi:hypothetical protein
LKRTIVVDYFLTKLRDKRDGTSSRASTAVEVPVESKIYLKNAKVSNLVDLITQAEFLISKKVSTRIWIPKVIVLVSEYPFYDYMRDILQDFYDYFKHTRGMNNVIETYVFNLVFRITVPQRD